MPTYSLITAVLGGHHEYLPETYASLRVQDLPDGWDWERIVREDGETGRPLALLPSDPRISSSTSPRSRAAIARTLALGRARGVVVRALDADDLLTDGALLRDLEALRDHPEVGWCLSPTTDLLPDGTERTGEPVADPGHIQPGYVLDARDQINLLSLAGSALCGYADLIRAVGGWPAVPANDDVALLLAVDEVSAGWMIDNQVCCIAGGREPRRRLWIRPLNKLLMTGDTRCWPGQRHYVAPAGDGSLLKQSTEPLNPVGSL
jgi:glycosyltransferase involved in cell wall biosynthesis